MKQINLLLVSLFIGIIFLLNYSGCSSVRNVQLNPGSNFDKKDSLMFYIIPTENPSFNDTYARVLSLDLMARGYKVINANRLVEENSDLIIATDQRQIADILVHKSYLPTADAYIIVQSKWDSAYVLTYYNETKGARWIETRFAGMFVPSLKSNVSFFARNERDPIKSYTETDTALVYSDPDNSKLYYTDYRWMLVAKQLSRKLSDIPICSVVDNSPPEIKFDISLWVDKSYRDAFPDNWKDRLKLRVLLANDLLRKQFNIALVTKDFVLWDSEFKSSLENSLRKLEANSESNPQQFQIGITIDKDLRTNWGIKSKLGLAMLLGNYAAITDQPSFQSVAQSWNSVEEALTLVHEVGHLLGAVHVNDNTSIMYPSAGYLSYEFDDTNFKIIETTKTRFFNVTPNERVQNYFTILNDLRISDSEISAEVLEPAAGAFSNLLLHNKILLDDQKKFNSLIISLSPDSAFAFAVKGYVEFENDKLKESKQSFTKSIELDSTFTEVKKYLALIPDSIQVDQNNVLEPDIDDNSSVVKKSSGAASKKSIR